MSRSAPYDKLSAYLIKNMRKISPQIMPTIFYIIRKMMCNVQNNPKCSKLVFIRLKQHNPGTWIWGSGFRFRNCLVKTGFWIIRISGLNHCIQYVKCQLRHYVCHQQQQFLPLNWSALLTTIHQEKAKWPTQPSRAAAAGCCEARPSANTPSTPSLPSSPPIPCGEHP